MVPRIVLTRSGPILVNVVRLVNIVQPRTAMNNAGPMKIFINNAYSTARRPFNKITAANNSNFTKKVNIVKRTRVNIARPKAVLSAVKGNKGNVVKASACWVWRPKHKVLDHVSRFYGYQMSFKYFDYVDAQRLISNETDHILQIMKKLMEDWLPLEEIPNEGKLLGKTFKLLMNVMFCLKGLERLTCSVLDLKNVVPQGGLKLGIDTILGNGRHTATIIIHGNHHSFFVQRISDVRFKPSREEEKKDAEDPRNESGNPNEGKDSRVSSTEEPRINQEKDDNINITIPYQINSTNNINTASDGNNTNNVNVVSSTVNTVGSEVNVVELKTSTEFQMIQYA
ncbi:hypothetical protein Tco_0732274 [Tanacetum coccineum]